MSYDFTSWDAGLRPDELAHFGVTGMRWGERRYQNRDGSLTALGQQRYGKKGKRSARGTTHDLNKLDREHANAVARRDSIKSWVDVKKAKAAKKAKKRGEPIQLSDRVKKYDAKGKAYDQLIKRNETMTNRIIQKSLKKGYSVKSRDTFRAVNKGRNAVASVLGTAAGAGVGAVTGTGFAVATGEFAQGKHYKVKNNGLGIRQHKSARRVAYGKTYRNS